MTVANHPTTATSTPPAPAPAAPPACPSLLVGRVDAARMCGLSTPTWDRQVAAGKTPKPLHLGGRVLWRFADLERWCELSCPDRKTFEALTADTPPPKRNGRHR